MRWFLAGLLIYGLGTGFQNGWIIVRWSQLFHDVGFTSVDPDLPIDWSDFILERIGIDLERK